jgi:hypothetical protein
MFLVIKALYPDWIRIRIQIGVQPKILNPDPDEMNADPQPCFILLLLYSKIPKILMLFLSLHLENYFCSDTGWMHMFTHIDK